MCLHDVLTSLPADFYPYPSKVALMPASTPSSPPKQVRAVETRAAIVRGAAVAFARHGFSAATLANIAKETKVTNGAFYHHFETREAVAHAVIEEYNATIRAIVTTAATQHASALGSVIAISATFGDHIRRDVIVQAGLVLTTEQGPLSETTRSPYENWITELARVLRLAQAQGDIRPELSIEQLAAYLVASFTGLQTISAALSHHRDLGERIQQGWDLLVPLIVPEEHQQGAHQIVHEQFG